MSLQWTFVAGFMYAEVFAILLLMIPYISPRMWQKLFHSRLAQSVNAYAYIYHNVFMAILALLFFDAVREVNKYSHALDDVDYSVPNAEALVNMRLFRAQRNLYISGFAFFLWMVLRRVAMLISTEATLIASNDASMRQATSASDTAKQLMDEIEELKKGDGSSVDAPPSKGAEELKSVAQELEDAKEQLRKARTDLSAFQKQAEGVNVEYDRLLQEHSKLQKQLESSDESKKDS